MSSAPEDRLRVLVDASVRTAAFGGIAAYTDELIAALSSHPRLALTVVTNQPHKVAGNAVRVIALGARTHGFVARAAWRESRLNALIAETRSDVLLAPVPELPLRRTAVSSVAVVHDVSQIAAPTLYGRARWLRFRVGLPLTCARAVRVVCDSQTALGALRRVVPGQPAEKFRVIRPGPQRLPAPSDASPHGRPYLLYVGSLLPHKNIDVILDALSSAESDLSTDFVLTGPATPEREAERLEARIRYLGLSDRVHHLGFVDRRQLSTLYRHARALVLPSLIEGFGLPVLEAMGLGTPAVASDIAAVREVGNDAVVYIGNPRDPQEWLAALLELERDEGLREERSRRAMARASKFSWDAARDEFAGVLHEAAGRT